MTVITETIVREGQEDAWDRAYHQRAAEARSQPGWIALQLLIPIDEPRKRVVFGTWQDRDAWETWHATDGFQRTREQLNAATESEGEERWFWVVEEEVSELA
jgi:heme-degrading monooxygenase HmoA